MAVCGMVFVRRGVAVHNERGIVGKNAGASTRVPWVLVVGEKESPRWKLHTKHRWYEQMEFTSILRKVNSMRIKHIRVLLALTRKEGASLNSYSPLYGMTLGEFCTAYVMTRQRSSIIEID
tara:strand:+ start:95 stop:457 length:363 start_codon:yes stop_codon:yes gene_type:complete